MSVISFKSKTRFSISDNFNQSQISYIYLILQGVFLNWSLKVSFCVLGFKYTGLPQFLTETKFSKFVNKQYQFTERKKVPNLRSNAPFISFLCTPHRYSQPLISELSVAQDGSRVDRFSESSNFLGETNIFDYLNPNAPKLTFRDH